MDMLMLMYIQYSSYNKTRLVFHFELYIFFFTFYVIREGERIGMKHYAR